MKKYIQFLLLFCYLFFNQYSYATNPNSDIQKSITMGVYVTSIYEINLESNYFGVDFLVWYVYRKEYKNKYHLDPAKTIKLLDIYNSELREEVIVVDSSLKNDIYILKRVSAKIRNDFDVKDFPFDKQELKLRFEDSENDMKKLTLNIEENGYSKSSIDNNIKIDGIKINSTYAINHEPYEYLNNFGNPKTIKSKDLFDRVVVTIDIEREVGFLFIKLFTGLYVSFFIAMLSFFISPKDTNTRFSLPVGSLFAAVGNKYFVDGLLPRVNSMTLTDNVHSVTFIFIFLIILFSVINIYAFRDQSLTDRSQNMRKLDMKTFVTISILFVIINLFFIIKSYSA